MESIDYIRQQVQASLEVKQEILKNDRVIEQVLQVSKKIVEILSSKETRGKVITAGNGGSAADAQHITAEFVSRFYFDRPALPSIALTTDTSIITAIGNDYGYENLFTRQIEANGSKGDVYIAISTSGNSPNIVKSLVKAREMGIFTVGLTGGTGGKMADLCDVCICVPSSETPRVQESHILLGHIICAYVEKEIFGGAK